MFAHGKTQLDAVQHGVPVHGAAAGHVRAGEVSCKRVQLDEYYRGLESGPTFIISHGDRYHHTDCAADFLLCCRVYQAIVTYFANGHKQGNCVGAYACAVIGVIRYN